MVILKEIYRAQGVNIRGKAIHREAVRGIILRGDQILMIHSPFQKDFKFPGGGVDIDETYEEALIREIREEAGAVVSRVVGEFGSVIEYDFPREREYDVFKMTSMYYICEVADKFLGQQLDRYELELGFTPTWVNIDSAIQNNQLILHSTGQVIPKWTRRDTFVLEQVKSKLFR